MTTFQIDSGHSDISFSVRHMVFAKVRGHFTKWSSHLVFDPANPGASSIEVSIDAASVDTRDPQRDGHLRSPDFLDVERFSHITYKSRLVERLSDKTLKVVGDLTLHGVTREVSLDVEELGRGKDPWGHFRVAFSARTSIKRADFGLQWNQVLDTGGLLVGDQIEIEIDVQAVEGG